MSGEVRTRLELAVSGMRCSTCGLLIDDALEDLPGVARSRTCGPNAPWWSSTRPAPSRPTWSPRSGANATWPAPVIDHREDAEAMRMQADTGKRLGLGMED